MKRICKIEIENSRAYYDRLTISLKRGENLLIYGENGSGKTSLYKSLNDFVQSFYGPVDYTQNRYKPAGAIGEVLLSIGDFDAVNNHVENVIDYTFAPGSDNTQVANTAFLKALALSKGFLNYRDLLKVYLYDEKQPNLFDFFVNHLLRNHVPLAQGLQNSLAKEWDELNHDIHDVSHRQERRHLKGLRRLGEFDTTLRSVLDNLFDEVNKFLSVYFDSFSLTIAYNLQPMSFSYGKRKSDWVITHDLRLMIDLESSHIDNYTEGLNEARLSAIAICLYLAALKAHPGQDMHLMFLDDIFIGIDSANRLPILEILKEKFQDFQIIISTYDRSWYFMAKSFISKHAPDQWKCYNLFSLPKTDGEKAFTVPVITEGVSAYDRAKEYLHGQRPVDLPAAANYFRKALEELFSEKYLPKELFLSDDYSLIPGFKLTKRVSSVAWLFSQIGENMKDILFIESYLHPLIHPLSHYEEDAQIYRSELLSVEDAIMGLHEQIAELPHKCHIMLGRGNKVEIHYDTADGSYTSKYQVIMDDNLWLYKDDAGIVHFTNCPCHCVHLEGVLNGKPLTPFSPNKKKNNFSSFCYTSLDDALQKIYAYEVNTMKHPVISHSNYDIVMIMLGKAMLEPLTKRRGEILATM